MSGYKKGMQYDNLYNLPIAELVDTILDYEESSEKAEARIAELNKELAAEKAKMGEAIDSLNSQLREHKTKLASVKGHRSLYEDQIHADITSCETSLRILREIQGRETTAGGRGE